MKSYTTEDVFTKSTVFKNNSKRRKIEAHLKVSLHDDTQGGALLITKRSHLIHEAGVFVNHTFERVEKIIMTEKYDDDKHLYNLKTPYDWLLSRILHEKVAFNP